MADPFMMQYVGVHQREIEAMFEGRVAFDGSEPVIGGALVVIAFTNRSGSNLLAEYIRICGSVNPLHEPLNAPRVRKMRLDSQARTFPAHVSWLAGKGFCGASTYLVKASWEQILMLLRWRIDRMFTSLRIIHIERLDVLAQAVSFSIAAQTGRWTSEQPGNGASPHYDRADILKRLEFIRLGNGMIRQMCSVLEIDTIRVTYEDLLDRPVAEVQRVHDWMGVPFGTFDIGHAGLERQATERNSAFVARFRAEARAELFGEAG